MDVGTRELSVQWPGGRTTGVRARRDDPMVAVYARVAIGAGVPRDSFRLVCGGRDLDVHGPDRLSEDAVQAVPVRGARVPEDAGNKGSFVRCL